MSRHSRAGFTLVELMIASSVFSVMLLVLASAVVQVGRQYYKGIIAARTQEVARSISDDIARSIQFGGANVVTLASSGASSGFCIDNRRYSYVVGREVGPGVTRTPRGLVVDQVINCTGLAAQDLGGGGVVGRDLLPAGMRLGQTPAPDNTGLPAGTYKVAVTVAYGDDSVLSAPPSYRCSSLRYGGQFCAVSALVTFVNKRVQ